MSRRAGSPATEAAYHCQACRHLSGGAFKLYTLGFSLARKSGIFFAAPRELADYFGVSVRTVYYWQEELEAKGFFECRYRGNYSTRTPSKFRPVSHTEWRREHPGECATKRETPVSGKDDPLVSQLWALSGGMIRFYPSQMRTLRHLAASDEEIAAEFRRFWTTMGDSPEKAQCRRAPRLFIAWLKAIPSERAKRFKRAGEIDHRTSRLARALTGENLKLKRRLVTTRNPIFSNQSAIDCEEDRA